MYIKYLIGFMLRMLQNVNILSLCWQADYSIFSNRTGIMHTVYTSCNHTNTQAELQSVTVSSV